MKQPVKPPQKSPLSQHTPLFEQTDWLIVIILGILAVSLVISIISWQGDAIAMRSIGGRWFQSDGWRAFDNAVAMDSNQHRNQVRPLFSLIALPITQVLKQIASLSDIQAIWGLNSLCFALWVGMIFLTLRLIGISQLGAVFTSLLGLTSGSFATNIAFFQRWDFSKLGQPYKPLNRLIDAVVGCAPAVVELPVCRPIQKEWGADSKRQQRLRTKP